ncbi:hypothetical protein L1987_27080 [Smallanthus sonchifolius]|uniref:Uncharacterized protein n=1 Tax=Smallanthus sonchifolius TaxID=185202 RepID=A0ACB9I9X9_9ASTR|nr:hypothetical protein L1987_27080 [Smallanthus sonchifolius]
MSILTCFFLALIIPYAASIAFNFTYISQNNSQDIILSGEASHTPDHGIQLTPGSVCKYRFVAVEFDTNSGNDWDPTDPVTNISIGDHVGININSMTSVVYRKWFSNITHGKECRALVNYDSYSKNLFVSFTNFKNNSAVWETGLDYTVDLSLELPEWVIFGFSASTGDWFQKNNIISWTFNSTELKDDEKKGKTNMFFKMGLTAGMLVLVTGLAILAYFLWRRNKKDAIDYNAQEKQVQLLEWVWELYGNGSLLEAVDPNLGSEFEEEEIRRLMIVGLSCVHPDSEHRPSMREAIKIAGCISAICEYSNIASICTVCVNLII